MRIRNLRARLEKVIRETTPDRKKTEKTYQKLAENFQGARIDF